MPRLSTRPPRYSRHKASGQAIVKFGGRVYYLGPHGSAESRAKYQEMVAKWAQEQSEKPNGVSVKSADSAVPSDVTVAELCLRYLTHANSYYQKNGKPTGTAGNLRPMLRVLVEMFELTLTRDFRPSFLEGYQHQMIERGCSRRYINDATSRIKSMFKWGVVKELVPPEIWQGLAAVTGLKKGRSQARETAPVLPVDEDTVDKTIPFLPPVVADMVRFQRLTGARPGEVCMIRPMDLERSGDVWTYTPESHKTEHHGRQRVIFIGPQAQEVLSPYLLRAEAAYCFSPRDSERRRLDVLHDNRRTPMSCGNTPGSNRKRRPRRSARECYDKDTYARAIARACEQAFPPPDHLARREKESKAAWMRRLKPEEVAELKAWQRDHRWSPNQLRHAVGTLVRRKYGLEAAQVVLGHSKANTTEIYAERDLAKAADVARQVG